MPALYFDKLAILDPVGATSETFGVGHHTSHAARLLKDVGILEKVILAAVLMKIVAAIRST